MPTHRKHSQHSTLSRLKSRTERRNARFIRDNHHPLAPSQRCRVRARRIRYLRARETARVARFLRRESVGGALIIIAAVLGFICANTGMRDAYNTLRHAPLGLENLGLHLDIGHFAADGLLAVFFFIVGLELKHEFVHGALSNAKTAIVPVAAAFGGVLIPASIYLALNAGSVSARGWALPTATDIAFAVAILGIIAPKLPASLRMFLLTLAVVDDLIAIVIIAVFYSSGVNFAMLGFALIPLALFAFFTRAFTTFFSLNRWASWVILLPLGAVTWAFFLQSGVHATIAGVLLAFMVPAAGPRARNLAEKLAGRYQPLSAGFCVPVFAFFASGVSLGGSSYFPAHPIVYGVVAGLVLGKPLGITLTAWLLTRFSKATLGDGVRFSQLLGVACLAGVGFTVSLLIADLSFTDQANADTARLAVMTASVIAVAVATAVFRLPRLLRR